MDASPSATPEPDATRRRSGRVVRMPSKYAPEQAATVASKRKRDQDDGQAGDEDENESGDDTSEEDNASDGEHQPPRSRKAAGGAKKSSSKKPKLNGSQPAGGQQVARIPSRPKKTVRIEAGEKGSGLFGMLVSLSSFFLPCYS